VEIAQARHAFVTGGASGIGLAIAEALAERAVAVTIADVDRETLETVAAGSGGRLRGQTLDVRDRDAWARAKAAAEAALGPVDIVVNNAGIAPDGREFADMDPASFDRIIGINLTGVFNGVSAFAAEMRERGRGHIVNTSSVAGITSPFPGVGAYAVAKFGVVALSEGLRRELAPHGVGVSVLCPGLVATNLARTTLKVGGQVRDPNAPMRSSGVSAADVGELVVQAIEQNQAYVLTHPDLWPSVEKRHEAIRAAFLDSGPAL
jgi:NAD(P)-dependent dehydrogenase (short-subunit alcohol dehydrogenase family)